MSLHFGEEIWIITGLHQNEFLFVLVGSNGLLLFDSMLFFGPSFSHLLCYFGYFLYIH